MEKKGNTGEKNKVNKHTSRYNFLPLLRFRPGGVQKEHAVCRSPAANLNIIVILSKFSAFIFD